MAKKNLILYTCLILVIGILLGTGVSTLVRHSAKSSSNLMETQPEDTQPEEESTSEPLEFTYQKWEYDGISGLCRGDTNLTSHRVTTGDYGWFLICSWKEYQDCMEIISKKLAEDPIITKENWYESFNGFRYTVSEDTLTKEIDEAFFEDSWLAVIDFMRHGDPKLLSALDSLVLEDEHTLRATVSQYYVPGTTADILGHLYWIQIPQIYGGMSLDVEFHTETPPQDDSAYP